MSGWLTADDREAVVASGRDPERVARALTRLAAERPTTRLVRPASRGDGILVLPDELGGDLEARAARAADSGRVSTFVPASGAATRLCAALWSAWEAWSETGELPADAPSEVRRVIDQAPRMALWGALEARGAHRGDAGSILAAMFGPGGLDLHRQPKALIPFHRYGDQIRTAFDEHVVEASLLARDAEGTVRVHMTVAPEHRPGFEAARARAARDLVDAEVVLTLSEQDPSTDLPALGRDGRPFRLRDGELLFRPGGHGALLGNLASCGGDIVLVKNIDNVVRTERRGPVLPWRRRLVGLLVRYQEQAWSLAEALETAPTAAVRAQARAFCEEVLGLDPGDDGGALLDRLHRPWRVAGMVRNTGKPGGGPFWAAGPDGPVLQIVESAEIDLDDPAQAEIVAASSHFNPVDMALGLRDRHGQPWDLTQWTNPSAVLFARKVHEGRPLRALEHPGLWNGQMARWNSVFVEIPEDLFQPVKALADLLSDGHVE